MTATLPEEEANELIGIINNMLKGGVDDDRIQAIWDEADKLEKLYLLRCPRYRILVDAVPAQRNIG